MAACIAALPFVTVAESAGADIMEGTYYHPSYIGSTTANGEIHSGGFEAATNRYPFGTHLLVCYDGCVTVRVNDTCGSCGLDLGQAASDSIGLTGVGRAPVDVTVL